MISRLLVRIENADMGLQQKAPKHGFVARSLSAYREPGAQFTQYDKGQPDFIGEFDCVDNGS